MIAGSSIRRRLSNKLTDRVRSKTTDLIGNFHYKPDNKNDFQFLIQNGLGDFIYSYGFQRQPGEPVPLTAVPCSGATANPIQKGAGSTWTGGIGGVAPNGQACPVGLAFGTANTQVGGGNIWHHYSGIGKLQWNHIINDHSFFALRLAENFNQYIFDQPIVDANIPYIENSPDFAVPGCPALPYKPGSPILASSNNKICAQESNWLSTGYYQDRRSNMYLASLDYTNDISENTEIQAGLQQEYDNNVNAVYYTTFFNPDGSWPGVDYYVNLPEPYSGSIRARKFHPAQVALLTGRQVPTHILRLSQWRYVRRRMEPDVLFELPGRLA